MRIFLFIYSLFMLLGNFFTLVTIPRALRDLGHERERIEQQIPEASFEVMVEAGYRANTLLLLVEILYYWLLLRYGGPEWQFFYGGFAFGVIHIGYLVSSRVEKHRLSRGLRPGAGSRLLVWLTALLTVAEAAFLVWVAYLLLQPQPAA